MASSKLGVITRFELRRLSGSAPGVLFLFALVFFYLWLGTKLASWSDEISAIEGVESMPVAADENPVYGVLGWFLDLEPAEIHQLFLNHPPILLILFAITIFMTPILTVVVGLDQTGSDIARRHVRFLVVRSDRTSLYVGKTLAVIILWAVALALALVAMLGVLVAAGGLGSTSVGAAIPYFLRIYATCFLFGLPFIALTGAFSALTGSAVLGAVSTFGLWFVVWLSSWALGMQADALGHIGFLFPTALKYQQMSDDMGRALIAIAYAVGYAGLAFYGGLTAFRRRDV